MISHPPLKRTTLHKHSFCFSHTRVQNVCRNKMHQHPHITFSWQEEKFRQYWMDKFRGGEPSPFDTVPVEAYQVLVRELIIAILSGSSGLQLKLSQSKSGNEIFCRIRAPLVRERVRASSANLCACPTFSVRD